MQGYSQYPNFCYLLILFLFVTNSGKRHGKQTTVFRGKQGYYDYVFSGVKLWHLNCSLNLRSHQHFMQLEQ